MQGLLNSEPVPPRGFRFEFWSALAALLFLASVATCLYWLLVFPPDTHERRVLQATWQGLQALALFAMWIASRKSRRGESSR